MAISVEKRNFPHPCVFHAHAERAPLELGTDTSGQKTRMMGLPDGQKVLR